MSCKSGAIPPLDLSVWQEIRPQFHVPHTLLVDAIELAKRDLMDVRHQEWQLARDSNYIFKLML